MTGQTMIKTCPCCLGSHKPEEGTHTHIHSLTQRMAATKNRTETPLERELSDPSLQGLAM